MEKDYKDKIRKLLALAESDNENEAKAALLKAKQLMAEYKIKEVDILDVVKKEVKRVETDIVYTGHDKPWISSLANLIADNYCCKDFVRRRYGERKRMQCFVGLDDDVDLCKEIFIYAYETIDINTKKLLKGKSKRSAAEKKIIIDSYANGFIKGLKKAYKDQEDESDWGLEMVTPQEVIDNMKNMKTMNFKIDNYEMRNDLYDKGRNDGENFSPHTKIKEKSNSSSLLLNCT